MLIAECQQDGNVECQEYHMEIAILENLFRQEAPIHRPFEQELSTKLKRSADVGNGIADEKW